MRKFLDCIFLNEDKKITTSHTSCSDLDVFVLTYNRADCLGMQLESLCQQTAQGFTIKVLDDASTDHTDDTIKEIQKKYPNRKIEHIKHEKNNINYYNFFQSQTLADNKYTAVFHDDDIVHPEYIQIARDLLAKYPEAVTLSCFYQPLLNPSNTNWARLEKEHFVWDGDNMPFLSLLISRLCFAAMIYRTDVYKTVEYHPEKYGKIFDNPFLLEMGTKGQNIFIQDIGLRYRQHLASDSNNHKTGPFVPEIISTLLQTKKLMNSKTIVHQKVLYNFANLLFSWSKITTISKRQFFEQCIAAGIFTEFEILCFNFYLSKKILKKHLRKLKKRHMKKTTERA